MSKVYPILLLLISSPALFTHAGGQKEFPLTIYYSSSLNGNLDGCECKSNPRAGLVKRAHHLRNAEHREKSPLIDAGDVLDIYPDELPADEIWEVYLKLRYDAVAVEGNRLGILELMVNENGIQDYSNSFLPDQPARLSETLLSGVRQCPGRENLRGPGGDSAAAVRRREANDSDNLLFLTHRDAVAV